MFEKFYGLERNPFNLTPDPSLFFFSEGHEEALSRIMYSVKQRKGMVVLTGEVGAGKTTVVRKFIESLGSSFDVILIFNTFLSPKQLMETILMDLDIPYKQSYSKAKMIRLLYDYLIEQRRLAKTVVLIIDEAQNLSPGVLEEVRMLTNLETETEKLLQIVLVGQPELKDLLLRRDMRQFKQRVFLHYHLSFLSHTEACSYIQHRLRRSGGNPDNIFTAEAVELIARSSNGIPRLMNLIADNCLITGFARQERPISVSTVEEVLTEMGYDVKLGESLWEG